MLRVAVPNKGGLAEPASAMLREAGYQQRSDHKDLVLTDISNEVEFFFLRPRDIAVYVGSGDLDVGVTGRDLLLDSHAVAQELLPLGFGASTFRFAACPDSITTVDELAGKRIASAFPGLVTNFLTEHGIDATVIRLDGAVETAIRLGVADVIADVVDTGATLRRQGLSIFSEPILTSEAVLIASSHADRAPNSPRIKQLVGRLQGVLVARRYVMLAYDVHAERLDAACALTPGIEAPTISPLHREGWVAVQAMVPRGDSNRIMDELYEVGARAILVTDIRACRI